jgi:hypothetical protein
MWWWWWWCSPSSESKYVGAGWAWLGLAWLCVLAQKNLLDSYHDSFMSLLINT